MHVSVCHIFHMYIYIYWTGIKFHCSHQVRIPVSCTIKLQNDAVVFDTKSKGVDSSSWHLQYQVNLWLSITWRVCWTIARSMMYEFKTSSLHVEDICRLQIFDKNHLCAIARVWGWSIFWELLEFDSKF